MNTNKFNAKLFCIGVALCLPLLFTIGYRGVASIIIERNVSGHIKRAADANSVELAKQELQAVVSYLDDNGIRDGYTSVIYRTPDEDVGFWHQNLTTSLEQLKAIPSTATQGEKDMVLLKLRQTLLDHGKEGEHVTMPAGVSVFPHNILLALILAFDIGLAIIGVVVAIVALPDSVVGKSYRK